MASEAETDQPLGVVLDTGLILQAALRPLGPAGAVLDLLEGAEVRVFLSPRMRSEIEDVLTRPLLRAKYPQLTEERARAILSRLDARAQLVPNPPERVSFPRDPKDEPVINLAVHVQASHLVTRDNDLLDLMHDAAFVRQFPGLTVVEPVAFLQVLRGRRTPALSEARQQPGAEREPDLGPQR